NPAGAGDFRLYVIATFSPHFYTQRTPQTARYDVAGFADGSIKWRANYGVQWTKDAWSVDLNGQYYGPHQVTYGDPEIAPYNEAAIQFQGAASIPSQSYFDLSAGYRLGASRSELLSNLELRFGIQNLLDTDPPIIAADTGPGYSPLGDPRLR